MPTIPFRPLLTAVAFATAAASGRAQTQAHTEARHSHSVALTPDGKRLLALDTPEARLSVFDVSNPANPTPVLLAEIPVGLEPVSVRARTDDEAWVVNELGDSVSVVSLSRGVTTATLSTSDEPSDVVFAAGKAFVSCLRSREVRVFDAQSLAPLASVPLQGDSPHALAASADGTRVFAAFLLSGNNTTTLKHTEAPAPPAPTNAALPPAPKSALIVPTSDPRVHYTVLDHDVAEVSTDSLTVLRYLGGVGTNLFDVAVHPATGDLWVPNTEALNLIRFEPALRGHFADNRVTRIPLATGVAAPVDLNPGLDYGTLPNPAAQATALAQPTALVWENGGAHAWVAAFASDRVAKLDATGAVVARVDVRVPAADSRRMRGPRSLALQAATGRLYVLNKLANTVSVIDTTTAAVIAEVPTGSHDGMPAPIKEGRGFLFDARLSGNGTVSCGTCHLDADRDGLAWDLGDPTGEMLTVIGYNNSIHDPAPQNRTMHPMKGALTTQTLRGFQPGQIFHWRGDKPTLQSFNSTFPNLLGGSLLPAADMDAMAAYLGTLVHHPNPHRNLDRTLPTALAGGNPVNGRNLFNSHLASHCITCHALPTGSDDNIDLMAEVGSTQPVKTPHLRTVYQRSAFSRAAGAVNVSGYGMLKDGTGSFAQDAVGHFYVLENLANLQEYKDVQAFTLVFDTGTAPAVGRAVTFDAAGRESPEKLATLSTLEAQARLTGASAACDLVAHGLLDGRWRTFLHDGAARTWRSDAPADPTRTTAELLALLGGDDALTFQGVFPGQGARFGGDRDGDGLIDSAEPVPALNVLAVPGAVRLAWPAWPDWTPETSASPAGPWLPFLLESTTQGADRHAELPPDAPAAFFRLRRTW